MTTDYSNCHEPPLKHNLPSHEPPKHEFVDILSLQPAETLKLIRNDLYTEAEGQIAMSDELKGLPFIS